MSNQLWRTRWAAIGAAVAVTLGAGGLFTASAAIGSGERTVYVPITPCRIMDTRPGQDNRGPRATPIGVDETHTIAVRGTNGDCTIPVDAVGVTMNVTSLNSTSDSFLTVYPADASARPAASSLNWRAGQAPTPNAVTTKLSADGRASFYNLAGTVDVIADVVGYYADHNHDDRYYTKQQVDASLATKADTADVTTALATKANTADVNAALAGKANSLSGTASALVIGPASFVHDGDMTSSPVWFHDFGSGRIEVATGTPCFAAAVMLPQGAIVTSFDAYVEDNSAFDMTASLQADPTGVASPDELAFVASSTQAAGVVQLTDNTLSGATIATGANAYSVNVCLAVGVSLYSVRISYTNP